jgi:SAM-dependent methyltransferase
MYSLMDYGWMLADRQRCAAFMHVMRENIGTDSVVLDLGAGPGLLSLYALKLGARLVYAIDPNPAIRLLAKLQPDAVKSGRLRIYCCDSRKVSVEEAADVVLADIRGPTSFAGGCFDIVTDACARLKKPGGMVYPQRDQIHVAPVCEEAVIGKLRSYWLDNLLDVDASVVFRHEMGQIRDSKAASGDLLAPSQKWGAVEWNPVPRMTWVDSLCFEIERGGRLDGFLQWFDLAFDNETTVSNSPGSEDVVYGRCSFLLSEPVEVSPGWVVTLSLRAFHTPSRTHWTWSGEVRDASGMRRHSFSESSLKSTSLLAIGAKSDVICE